MFKSNLLIRMVKSYPQQLWRQLKGRNLVLIIFVMAVYWTYATLRLVPTGNKNNVDNDNDALLYHVRLPTPAKPKGKPYTIMIYVRSAVHEFELRQVLRQTWMKDARRLHVPVLFALGHSSDERVNARVEVESVRYNDILQFEFIDDYHNLSIKTFNVLDWHIAHTPTDSPTLLFWTNSDALVQVDRLLELIDDDAIDQTAQPTIYGQCSCSGPCRGLEGYTPDRNPKDKWYMPSSLWPHQKYPHYCISYAALMSPGCVERIMVRARKRTLQFFKDFWIDDMVYTGILAQEAELYIKNMPLHFLGVPSSITPQCVAVHLRTSNPTRVRRYWDEVQQTAGKSDSEEDAEAEQETDAPKSTRRQKPTTENWRQRLFERYRDEHPEKNDPFLY